VDHFVPKDLDGRDHEDNYVVCCHLCNIWKKDKSFKHIGEVQDYVRSRLIEVGAEIVSTPDPGRVDANLQKEEEGFEDITMPGVRVRGANQADCITLQRSVSVSSSDEEIQEEDKRGTTLPVDSRLHRYTGSQIHKLYLGDKVIGTV
jgi:hypothetical protein